MRVDDGAEPRPEHRSIFKHFSGHADGERRGLDRIGGWHRKGLGWDASSDTFQIDHGSSAFAVGTLRDFETSARPPHFTASECDQQPPAAAASAAQPPDRVVSAPPAASGWEPPMHNGKALVCNGHSSAELCFLRTDGDSYHMRNGESVVSYTDPLP